MHHLENIRKLVFKLVLAKLKTSTALGEDLRRYLRPMHIDLMAAPQPVASLL